MNPTQNKTRIVYETELDMQYDLQGNAYQREQMLGKCQRMAIKFGSMAAFRKRLEDKAEILRLVIKPKIEGWWSLQQQIAFVDKVMAGEIKIPEDKILEDATRDE